MIAIICIILCTSDRYCFIYIMILNLLNFMYKLTEFYILAIVPAVP